MVIEDILLTVCVIVAFVLVGCAYALMGGPALWGEYRGVPMCGHPFEQTWSMHPQPREWYCPKCGYPFRRDDKLHRWVPMRRWGRDIDGR